MARGVVVLGMHRSGTSAATRLVNLLGVPLPSEGDLLPHAFDNPRGHWESRSLVEFNDRVLAARGCDWTCPVEFPAGWEREAAEDEGLRAEARALFRRTVTTPQWVWKDPRNCLLLPFWMRALEVRPVALVVLRHPIEIAASLEARDHFDKHYCLALWERYMRICIESIAQLPAKLTTYDALLADPVSWCHEVQSFLDREGIDTHSAAEPEVRSFVEPALRHERSTVADLTADPDVSPSQRALSDALRIATGRHSAFGPPPLPPETESTGPLLEARRRALIAVRESIGSPAP